MKKNNDLYDKQFGELFRQVKTEQTSPDFVEKLTARIATERRKAIFRRKLLNVGMLAASIAAVVLIPFAVIHWVKPDFQLSLPDLGGQPYGALIGLTVLLLLISDTLLRKQFMR